MSKTIVILGAGFTGLPLAHKLLKYTAPKSGNGLKVILVTPNSKFYWNLAAVRGVIPGAIPDEELFLPIADALTQYPSDNYEFVLGKAKSVVVENNIVELALNDGSERSILYDHLVIATGSSISSNLPFKLVGAYEETLEALHALQKQIDEAKSIVIAGAGPTGVETAGELAAAYGNKKQISLIIGNESVLQTSKVSSSVVRTVEQDLTKLGVKLIRNAKVQETHHNPVAGKEAGTGHTTTLRLSSGETLVTDCYIPLFGVRVNTSFLPAELLDESGNLILDKTLRAESTTNVWGIGDVGNLEPKQVTNTDAQIIYLAGTLDRVLDGKGDTIKEYKPLDKTMVFISLGHKYATGQIGNWRLWGWIVAYVKGRKIFVDTAADYVGGKKLRHAAM